MGSPGRLLRDAAAITVAALVVTAAVWTGDDAGRLLVQGGLVIVIVVVGLSALRLLHDIREQQRRIIEQLETQTRVMHSAARLVRERADEPDVTQ